MVRIMLCASRDYIAASCYQSVRFFNVAKIAIAITKSTVTYLVRWWCPEMTVGTRMSFSRWRKVVIDGDDWTWTGKMFEIVAGATGNEQRLMAVGRTIWRNEQLVCRWPPKTATCCVVSCFLSTVVNLVNFCCWSFFVNMLWQEMATALQNSRN